MDNLPTRNQNPGDLKDPVTGNFRKFSTPAEGKAALYNDLTAKMTGTSTTGVGPSSSLVDFAKVYAPAADKNDPIKYAADLANHMGVSPDTQIGSLKSRIDDFANAVSKNEGYMAGGQVKSGPVVSTTDAPTETKTPDTRGTLHKIADWAFPIIEDFGGSGSNKTALQKLGDVGLSAMWFLPGLGEAGGLLKGSKLAVEGGEAVAKSGLLPKILKGAVSGYGTDVASSLSQGKTGSEAFKPGLGTVTGGVLEGTLGKLGGKYGQEGVVENFAKENNSVLGQTKRGANDLVESFSKGKDPGEFMAKKGVNLKSLVNPETVAYETAGKASEFRQGAKAVNTALTDALKNVTGTVNVSELENELISKVPKNYPERADLIKREMGLLKQQYGENVSVADLNEWKQRAWDFSKFDTAVPNETRKTYRQIGHLLKTEIEDVAKKNGLDGVAEMNEYIGSHLDSADALDTLHGTKAKGGRAGDLLQKHVMGGIGALVGSSVSPIGALFGAIGMEMASGKVSAGIRKIASSPLKTSILKKIEQEDPQIVKKFIEYANKESPVVAQLRKEMGGTLGKTMEKSPVEKVSPLLNPKAARPGLIRKTIPKIATRLVTDK